MRSSPTASWAASRSSPATRSASRPSSSGCSTASSSTRISATGASRSWARRSAGSSCTARGGCTSLYHGDEAVVDSGVFDLEGRAIRKVRQSVQPAPARGLHGGGAVTEPRSTSSCASSSSRSRHSWRGGQPERGFVMALDGLFSLGDENAIFVIGRDRRRRAAGLPALRARPRRQRALALVDAARTCDDPERVQRVADLRGAALGARARLPARLAQLLAVRGAARRRTCRAASAASCSGGRCWRLKGHFQLDNLLAFNRKFFPALGAPVPRLRAAHRPAAGRDRRPRRRGVPPLPDGPPMTAARARCSALGSALALNWGFFVQHGAAGSLPPLTVRRPLHSLRLLFANRRWLAGFLVGPRRLGAVRRSAPPGAALARAGRLGRRARHPRAARVALPGGGRARRGASRPRWSWP